MVTVLLPLQLISVDVVENESVLIRITFVSSVDVCSVRNALRKESELLNLRFVSIVPMENQTPITSLNMRILGKRHF